MADLLARGLITIAAVSDGYTLSLSAASVSIPANHDGSNPDLSCANTLVKLSKGGIDQIFSVINVIPSCNGIKYTYESAGPYAWKITITDIASNITSGYLEIIIQNADNYKASIRFNFSVVHNTAGSSWIDEWNGTHNQIGENYVITPKLFAGHKSSDGKITGIYLGKLKGFIGEIFPFTLADAEEGIYGYRDNKIVFFIDNNGAKIGGWDITPGAIQCEDGTLTIKSAGAISSQSNGTVHWSLNKDGSASFANGKVTMDSGGNATFEGKITAISGKIAGWEIGKNSLSKVGVAINSTKRFIAVANVVTTELSGNQFDWVKAYGGVAMYYVSAADYGFTSYKGTIKTFSAGSVNYIAGWNFDDSAIWLGAKNNNAGQFTVNNSSITVGTNGIRGWKWRLDKNGSGALANGNISWDENGNVTFTSKVALAWANISDAIGNKLTKIDANGIYTGTLTADQINSGTISTVNIKQTKNIWYLNQDGSGALANGNIKWDAAGNVTFADSVIATWKDQLIVGAYTITMSSHAITIPAEYDGSNPDLTNAYTSLSIFQGRKAIPFSILNVYSSVDGVKYTYSNIDNYSAKVAITHIGKDVKNGFLTISVKTIDGFETSIRFSFNVSKSAKELAFLEDWEGTYTQIGSNYVISPRIFAGNKAGNGKITGVYIGPYSGYLGQRLPFALAEPKAGIYGYNNDVQVFFIDNTGASIAGWSFDNTSIYLGTKNNTSGQYTSAAGSITIGSNGIRGFKWFLNANGSGSLAAGNITWDANGNVSFSDAVTLKWSQGIDDAKELANTAQKTATDNYNNLLGTYLTKISHTGIYTGSLTADQVQGLSCNFTSGSIGGWSITSNSISKNDIYLGANGDLYCSYGNVVYWRIANSGDASFAKGKVKLNKDGSGSLAAGNITWDANGNLHVNNAAVSGNIYTPYKVINQSNFFDFTVSSDEGSSYNSTVQLEKCGLNVQFDWWRQVTIVNGSSITTYNSYLLLPDDDKYLGCELNLLNMTSNKVSIGYSYFGASYSSTNGWTVAAITSGIGFFESVKLKLVKMQANMWGSNKPMNVWVKIE